MPKKSKSSAVEIAEEQKPGWKAVPPSGPMKSIASHQRNLVDALDDTTPADSLPPTKQIQSKAKKAGSTPDADAGANTADESNSRVLESNTELVDMKSGDVVRTFGVNTSTKKLDWSQG